MDERELFARSQEEDREESLVELEPGQRISRRVSLLVPPIPGKSFRQQLSVFLSYGAKNAALAEECRDIFEDLGVTARMYYPDLPWNDPVGEVALRIATAGAVVLLEPLETASLWVRAELAYAQARAIPVFACEGPDDAERISEMLRAGKSDGAMVFDTRDEEADEQYDTHVKVAAVAGEILAAAGPASQGGETFGELGMRYMAEEALLKRCFYRPLLFEFENPSNPDNRIVRRTFPSPDVAWAHSDMIRDLYSASQYCLESPRADRLTTGAKSGGCLGLGCAVLMAGFGFLLALMPAVASLD